MRGLILAAPASGAGKTTLTLALLRLLSRQGLTVRGAKSGPDYIDPRFHEAACGAPCPNLDAWAMTPERLRSLAAGDGLLIIEGAMGLFDGAPPDGRGAVADLARHLALPVVLVVDAGRMAGSIAPLVAGFAGFDPNVRVAGVMLNNVGSDRHEAMLRRALAPLGLPVLAALRRNPALAQPSRHLGLVQAIERPDLDHFLDTAADALTMTLDRETLRALAAPLPEAKAAPRLTPPAQVIAVAQDRAFGFAYPHMLADWRAAGAEMRPFSPLADDPVPEADFVFLPGGYPELHAGQIAANTIFMQSLRNAAQTTDIYGECGGYMVLGEGLTGADGTRHVMAGLLPLETSFATRQLHLGYRHLEAQTGPFPGAWAAHEFHYATTLRADGPPLFAATDAEGTALPPMGLHLGRVSGSFAHLIDRA
ncbi:MAG: cobyrinic acid a,c-diamide synthase [Roseovarius sp. BRH_c41]|uniref:cobyrinate a,c-diamide synthase n=1 Tax=Roseovarius sp. BRH_c41 TaxID=1629709 RepID=UPI0005F16D22|nr:cobyrinate a,c-diamide synthase [Roseovarius sp. BRH_c41]KJS43646.1 MAG: cobyrinic acid a,c-diamide synthase [Roseovarius sp. BRH_c41]